MTPKVKLRQIEAHPDFYQMSESILRFWKENKIFEKSVDQRDDKDPYVFYDGPPFVTGTPHYGHILGSVVKDLIPRYFTMKGKRVRRVWGWDCHGLPIENKVEKTLKLKSRRDIERIGLETFIQKCFYYVSQTSSEWNWYIDRIGRWVDMEHAYRTLDLTYMETVMWVFKQLYDKDLVYEGKRVSLYCPHDGTPVSNFEIAMDNSYIEVNEPSTVYKYRVKDQPETYLLAWSTTPWNKIATPALAVNPKLTYIKVKEGDEYYILAQSTQSILKKIPYKVVEKFKGTQLVGVAFEPHFDFWPRKKGKKAFVVVAADYVSAEEGTGIVTLAVYGEDDYRVMQEKGIQMIEHLDADGNLKPAVKPWAGKFYLEVNPLVNQDLARRNLVYREDPYEHSIPVCWRCGNRLIFAPQDAWFVKVSRLKQQMLKTSHQINWVPRQVSEKRFLNGIENAPDWCISRNRYWATPMPVWKCQKCHEEKVVGSIAEIEKLSGKKVKDLHRPYIDEFTFSCPKCGGKMGRIKEVLDCWLESGSMPYGERHYPFENRQDFERSFPADFVSEYVAQTRAWFYVLHVLSNALFGKHCFKNCIVSGVILGTDGRKMSKSYGNYPDPRRVIEAYGGDALRLYLMTSPVMAAGSVNISEKEIAEQNKKTLLILWNAYRFWLSYAIFYKFEPGVSKGKNVLDSWLRARLKKFCLKVRNSLEAYEVQKAAKAIRPFVTDLSTWYVRRCRDRMSHGDTEALSTFYFVLKQFLLVTAPVIPFTTEAIYRNLLGLEKNQPESVHLCLLPQLELLGAAEQRLLMDMKKVRLLCELGNAQRKEKGIQVRQPLALLKVKGVGKDELGADLVQLVKDELNVKRVEFLGKAGATSVELETKLTPLLREEGEARELIRSLQEARKKAKCRLAELVVGYAPSWPKKFEEEIKEKAYLKELKRGEKVTVAC